LNAANAPWPEFEQFLADLPPALFRQGVLLRNELALRYSDSGRLEHSLTRRQDHPLLRLHRWLLDDWQIAPAQRPPLEKTLPPAMAFAFAAVHLRHAISDRAGHFDDAFSFLADTLARQADFLLASLFPAAAPYWAIHHRLWHTYAEAALLALTAPADVSAAALWAYAKIPAAVVAFRTGREELWPPLEELLDHLNAAFQLCCELATLKPDIHRRHFTPLLLRAMAHAKLDPQQPLEPEQILGALVLTGALREVSRESRASLAATQKLTDQLNLPTFTRYAADLGQLIDNVTGLFSLKKASAPPKIPRRFFVPHIDALTAATTAAAQFLLADPTFRESRDYQPGLSSDGSLLVSRAFPAGLVVESLCGAGHSLPGLAGDILAQLEAVNYRYYPLPGLPPDADDAGLALRLFCHLDETGQQRYRPGLQAPLQLMHASLLPTGEIPVWFTAGQPSSTDMLVWGHSCAATETNLLLGLIDFDWAGYRSMIERAAISLFRRYEDRGFGAALYYGPAYILWVTFELLHRLNRLSTQPEVRAALNRVTPWAIERFERETHRSRLSSQEMALLGLAGKKNPGQELVTEEWRHRLIKNQRHDGSWPAEPLFLIPDRGGTAWYSSRLVTTALCYRALKSSQG
jgi:hypothetical protein